MKRRRIDGVLLEHQGQGVVRTLLEDGPLIDIYFGPVYINS